jgi:hypothetical protein
MSWPTGLYAESMTTPEPPLANLLGVIADEDKEFQASLARDRAEITLWDQNPGLFESALVVDCQQDAATERFVLKEKGSNRGLATNISAGVRDSELPKLGNFGALDRSHHEDAY